MATVSTTADGLDAIRSEGDGPLRPVERLRRLAGVERADLATVIIYAFAIGLISLAVPITVQSIVNTGVFTGRLQPIIVLALVLFAGLLGAGALRVLQHVVVEMLQRRFFVRATHDAIRRLVRGDVRGFHGAPEVMNRFLEVPTIQKSASTLLLDGVSLVLQGVVSLVLLAFYHPFLLAFDVVLIASIAFIVFGLGRGGVKTAVYESKAKYATVAWLEEVAATIRTFKSAGGAEFARERADRCAHAYLDARAAHFRIVFWQHVAGHLLQALALASLLGIGGYLVIAGELSLGQLVAAELIVAAVVANASKLGKYLASYYDLAASIDKVGTIADLPAEREGGLPLEASERPAHLVVDRLTYEEAGTVSLQELSFEVRPGDSLAVLDDGGPRGAHLADLIYGCRPAKHGKITLDGIDLRTIGLGSLRRDIALVERAGAVDLSTTDNLRLACPGADARSISAALDAVGLGEVIAALPEGIDTRLGYAGTLLTRNQLARLAIARALLAGARLILFDHTLDELGDDQIEVVLRGIAKFSGESPRSLLVITSRASVAKAVGRTLHLVERADAPTKEVHQ